MIDLVIRGGEVVDGSGAPRARADVGVDGGRIVEVGRVESRGRREVDAEGCVVAPGFLDGHTHMDAQVFWDQLGTSSCWQGVTTVVMGNTGFTLAPSRDGARDLVVRSIERAEDISPAAMAAGIDWDFETFPQYLDAVEAVPKAINYVASVGHSAVRTWVMGERAYEDEATPGELDEMARVVAEAVAAGAAGLTTTRNGVHMTRDDRPVASRLGTWDEVVQLVAAVARAGGGVFQITPDMAAFGPEPDERLPYWHRLRDLALDTGVTVVFGVLATEVGATQLAVIDETAAAGGRMFGMSHSKGTSTTISFATQLPFDRLAEWREVRRLSLDRQSEALRDPVIRKQLVDAAAHGDYGTRLVGGAEPRPPDYERMFLLTSGLPPHPTVAQLATAAGVHPAELMIDVALDRGLQTLFVQPNSPCTEDDLELVMRHPRTVMTFSDAGAHVSQVADASIHTHLLSYWVREKRAFTLEEAVHMVTQVPAGAWGVADRGLVREGLVADLNVFDPETLAPEVPTLVYDLPGGGRRLVQRSRGYRATVVSGEVAFVDGEETGARSGRLLRRRAAGLVS